MSSLRRIFRFIRPYRHQLILAILLIVGLVVVDLAIPRLTQDVIDQGVAERDLGKIVRLSLLMIGASILSAGFAIVNTLVSVRVAQHVAADIREAVVTRVQSMSFANLDKFQTGQLLTRTTSDIMQVQMIVLMTMRMFMRAPLWMIGSVAMLLINTPQIAWLMAVLLPLILAIMAIFVVKGRPMFMAVQKRLERLNEVMQENLSGMRVVKAFVRTGFENQRFGEANDSMVNMSIQVMQLLAVLMPTVFLVINLATAAAVWVGGNRVIAGTMTLGQLMASFNYLTRALFPVLMLGGMVGMAAAADASAERILEVLDEEPAVTDRPGVQPHASIGGKLAFENVSFAYDGDEAEPVLCGVSFEASPGETVALLGATGSGKSSLVHLIPRFYDIDDGRITLDGVDIRDIPLSQLRAQVGMAMQEAVLFSGTVRDNIRYGRPEASDEEVVAAAQAAQAHDFIMTLPKGYDAMVGQRGVNLSGGQKQRISIARALLVSPKILILDDSTSAVDVETEIEIERALEHVMAGRTSIVIAQRISTVLNADRIIVLDGGQVSATGTHAELVASSPIYQEIYASQLGDREVNHG